MRRNSDHETDRFDVEPYKILFPLGVLCAFVGVLLWTLLQFRLVSFYPKFSHGNLMYFGFMWAFIAGFLMTAIPKMTSTFAATFIEVSFAILLCLMQVALAIRNEIALSSYLVLLQQVFLILFVIRRLKNVKKIPFSGFLFVPTALLISLSGSITYIFSTDRSILLLICGEAFILNLILGLGSRLVAVISRLPQALMPDQVSQAPPRYLSTIAVALLFNFTFVIQLMGYENVGPIVRALVLVFALFKYFGFMVRPVKWTSVGIGLKISTALLPVGTLLSAPFLGSPLAGAHILYIGGFALIALLISTRVILAHGGESLDYEISSRQVVTFTLCLISASALRYVAGHDVISIPVQIAVILFLVSIGAWSVKWIYPQK